MNDHHLGNDITTEVLLFSEVARHVWNTVFLRGKAHASAVAAIRFAVIERELLKEIVLDSFDMTSQADNYGGAGIEALTVVPAIDISALPMQLGERDQHGNMRWQVTGLQSVSLLRRAIFVRLFDWNPYGALDHAHVEMKDPLTNRHILIEKRYCKFVMKAR
ncbi:MAG: hypothetical protein LC098_12285 [Burkholderiales bacterium]|nr:hypothetical protein [Burkholderiales bacterium]